MAAEASGEYSILNICTYEFAESDCSLLTRVFINLRMDGFKEVADYSWREGNHTYRVVIIYRSLREFAVVRYKTPDAPDCGANGILATNSDQVMHEFNQVEFLRATAKRPNFCLIGE